jgi:hypothetical protein
MDINPQAAIIIGMILYKVTCLLVGLAICFMGYRLFLADVKVGSSDASVSWKGAAFSLQLAPGTFFALFGAVIVSVTVWKGLKAKVSAGLGTPAAQTMEREKNATPNPSGNVVEKR